MRTVEEQIIESLREITGIGSIKADSDFLALGLNSIKLVEFAASLGEIFQMNIETSDLFDNPSLERLAEVIRQRKIAATPQQTFHSSQREPIAIVSVAFKFPGASNFAELQDLLFEGRTVIRKMPAKRQELLGLDAQQSKDLSGAYLDGIEMFDAEAFGLTAAEAKYVDPQQRLILELTSQCLLQSGLSSRTLKDRNIGVFVGASGSEFERSLLQKGMEPRGVFATGTASSLVANRVSYVYDLRGPSCAFDSACSSSLVALHYACESLLQRECTQALVGGVNLLLSPLTTATLAQAGMLSREGRITPFDDAAAGYVRGEGAAMLLLKPLSDAVKDGDPILAVIAASAARHHGHSNGLVSPMPSKQAAVIREAVGRSGVDPKDIFYFETHGTGTRLGDQVEIAGLVKAFSDDPPETLNIGSVKANFGHLEACAGLAGLVKLLMIFQEGKIPPLAQFQIPNSQIAWPAWLQVPKSLRDRPIHEHEGACLSSFGFGGMNAHVVMKLPPQRLPHIECFPMPVALFGIGTSSKSRMEQARLALHTYLHQNKHMDLATLATHWNRAYSQGALRESFVVRSGESVTQHPASNDASHQKLRLLVDSGLDALDSLPEHLLRRLPRLKNKTGELTSRFMGLWADFLLILPSSPTDETIESCKSAIFTKLHIVSFLKALQDYGFTWDEISAHAEHLLISHLLVDFIDFDQWLNLEIFLQFVKRDLLDRELFEEQLEAVYAESAAENRSLKGLTLISHRTEAGESDYEKLLAGLRSLYVTDDCQAITIKEPCDPAVSILSACLMQSQERFALWLASLYCAGRFQLSRVADDFPRIFLELPEVSVKASLWPEELSWMDGPAPHAPASSLGDTDSVIESLLLEILDIEASNIWDDARMQSDLGMDSIQWFHLVSDVSLKLKVDIGRSDSVFILDQTLVEFKAMVRNLQSKTQGKSPSTYGRGYENECWKAYLSGDWISNDEVEIVAVPKSFVHKHHEINVFVESMLRFKAHPNVALALMKHHTQHPFFYEHPQDHIPGLYLAEAARQCAEAFIHAMGLDQHDTKFILKSSKNQFFSFCDLQTPVIMQVRLENADLATPRAQAQDVNLRIDIYQGGMEKGFVEGHFTFMNSRIYRKLRQQPERGIIDASV